MAKGHTIVSQVVVCPISVHPITVGVHQVNQSSKVVGTYLKGIMDNIIAQVVTCSNHNVHLQKETSPSGSRAIYLCWDCNPSVIILLLVPVRLAFGMGEKQSAAKFPYKTTSLSKKNTL